MHKVRPGDPLDIRADDFNTMVDLVNDHRRRQHNGGGGSALRFSRDFVLVKNNVVDEEEEPVALPRFAVLELADPILNLTTHFDGFAERPAFNGIAPTGDPAAPFVILQEPARPGQLARAHIADMSMAIVTVPSGVANPRAARPIDGNVEQLQASNVGAKILWIQPSGSVRRAVVDLSCFYDTFPGLTGEATAIVANQQWEYVFREALAGSGGSRIDFPDGLGSIAHNDHEQSPTSYEFPEDCPTVEGYTPVDGLVLRRPLPENTAVDIRIERDADGLTVYRFNKINPTCAYCRDEDDE